MVGLATWMKTWGLGVPGWRARCMPAWRGRALPLRRLQGAHEATMFSQLDGPSLGSGHDVVDGEVRARAAVLAGPVVAGEHRPPGDLAAMGVARDSHVADEANHHRARHGAGRRVQLPFRALDHLRLLLEQEHDGPAHRADVDRLIRRVQYEHPANLTPAPLVLPRRRGPEWRRWNRGGHGRAGKILHTRPAASGRWKRPEHAQALDVLGQSRQPGRDRWVVVAPLEVGEEHVAAQALFARA